MKKFIISSGCNIDNSVPKEYVEQYSKQEMLNNYVDSNLYELENTILEIENEEEAMAMFSKMRSEVICQGAGERININYNIVEMSVEEGEYEEGEWNPESVSVIGIAPV